MNFDNLPPSYRFQYWGQIFFLMLLFGLLGGGLFIYFSWGWIAPVGSFGDHLQIFKMTLEEYWGPEESYTWIEYKYLLESEGILTEFYLQLILPLVLSFTLSTYISLSLLYVRGGRTLDRVIKGVIKLKGAEVKRHSEKALNKQLKNSSKQKNKGGLFLHPDVQVSKESEVGNLLITGKPGSGKTVIIKWILKQLLGRPIKLFIYDEKRDYSKYLFNPKSSILIAPWDKRGAPWDIAKDLEAANAPANFVRHIIPESTDQVWSDSARLIMQGLIISLKKNGSPWGWVELYESMTMEDRELQKVLKQHFPIAIRFIEEKSKTTQGIMISLISNLEWMQWLATAWPKSYENGFSIHQWVHDKKSKQRLIVQGNQLFTSIGGPLCRALMSLMVDDYLAKKDKQSLYLILDELASLPKTASLDLWLKLAREKGGRTVIGTQAISQLKSLYGVDEANSFTSYFSNLIVLKVGATGETKNYMSDSLGVSVIERPQYSQSQGKTIVNWQQFSLPVVEPTELTQLPDPDKKGVTGFLSISGWSAVYELTWPYPQLSEIAKSEVPASWLKGKNTGQKENRSRLSKRENKSPPMRVILRRQEAR